MTKRFTTECFIMRARDLHGGAYDYSKTDYKNANTKVTITCPMHGDFEQIPYHHLRGTKCPKCSHILVGSKRKSDLESFILKAINKHGHKYDYSETIYLGNKKKVEICCPTHGLFWQTPSNHLTGFGCKACGVEKRVSTRKLTADTFFDRCRLAFNNKYNYPDQSYLGPDSIIKAICPEHGPFHSGARNHLWNKRGCPECGRLRGGETRRINVEDWLELAQKLHAGRYEYDLSAYTKGTGSVRIRCKKHGWFKQRGYKHLGGQGCNQCARERLIGRWQPETLSPELANELCHFYYMAFRREDENFYKVGISNNINRRLWTLKKSGYLVTLLYSEQATRKECLEREIAVFESYDQLFGYVPKIPFPGSGECFAVDVLGLENNHLSVP